MGVVDWLLACPEKGFFVRVPSESTGSLSKNVADANAKGEKAGCPVIDPFES